MIELELRALNVEINNDALSGNELPDRIKILNWGKNDTSDGDSVYLNDQTLRVFDAFQAKTGRDEDIAIDFEHNSVPDSKEFVKGQARDIAGYGNPLLIKGDGLYLKNIRWTPIGKEKASNYKDLSPACPVTKDGVVTGLHSVALTTNGAVKKLKFYNAQGFEDMIKMMAVKDYNKDDANAGVKQKGDKYEANVHPMAAPVPSEQNLEQKADSEHAKNSQILSAENEHPDDCMCAMCMSPNHMGADDGWTGAEHDAHKNKVKEFSDDDHYSKYGDVKYADETNHRYPIDNEKHIRAAWSYVNMPKNAKKLGGKLSEVKSKISAAMKKIGADVKSNSSEDKTKKMSANNAQPYKTNMENTKIKSMASSFEAPATAEDKDGKSDSERVLFALLAKFIGEHPEFMEQLVKKADADEGGLAQWSAKVENIENEVKTFKAEQTEKQAEAERQAILSQATKEGKMITLSANAIKKLDITELKDYVAKLETVVPLKSKMKVLSASENAGKPSKAKAIEIFNAMLAKA